MLLQNAFKAQYLCDEPFKFCNFFSRTCLKGNEKKLQNLRNTLPRGNQ